MGYTISLEKLLCCQARMLLMEEEFLLELPSTWEAALPFEEVQYVPSYFCSTSLRAGEYGPYRCLCLGSLSMPFPGLYTQKGPDVAIDAWSMQRQGRNRLHCLQPVVRVLSPTVKGLMRALCDPSICTLAS